MTGTAIAAYIVLFSVTFLIAPLILASLLRKIDLQDKYSSAELFIYAGGGAPALIALFIYYLLFLIPGMSELFYPAAIILLLMLSSFFLRKQIKKMFFELIEKLKENLNFSSREGVMNILFAAGVLMVFAGGQYLVLHRPLVEHDILEYATQAKIFFRDRALEYLPLRYDELSGFFYVGLHGFLFIMLSVWEQFFNSCFGLESDYLFRSMTNVYGILILLTAYYWLRKIDTRLALISGAVLMLNSGIITTFLVYHVDMFRIFLLMSSVILMLKAINSGDRLSFLLLGIFSGLSANAHSIGVFAAFAFVGIVFLLMDGNFLKRVRAALFLSAIILLFGGLHYVVDIFNGTGWIFKDIKFY
ncbi:MAG: hypothetical protein DWQ39_12110 [Bacteroidetes bacterium]|nr:MAG: hypothetical protein DWQ33_06990 [Bacteroidota bacterium]REJ99669.1 MAG: hypothetical protein DWQ39_12110 [Bacteroidota bacterium]REK47667.1 MAG: hypothetical protein DWQ48_11845 [Bacteroidota bacterium]